MPATGQVILVDCEDRPTGTAEKLSAHRNGLCHRAFSIFLFSHDQQYTLLQQRARGKYHSADLWTNTCCSHPAPGEDLLRAGQRRLQEEMGITASLTQAGWFHYIAQLDNGMTENEVDHVLMGTLTPGLSIQPAAAEVRAWRWIHLEALHTELVETPNTFTCWFAPALEVALRALKGYTDCQSRPKAKAESRG